MNWKWNKPITYLNFNIRVQFYILRHLQKITFYIRVTYPYLPTRPINKFSNVYNIPIHYDSINLYKIPSGRKSHSPKRDILSSLQNVQSFHWQNTFHKQTLQALTILILSFRTWAYKMGINTKNISTTLSKKSCIHLYTLEAHHIMYRYEAYSIVILSLHTWHYATTNILTTLKYST